MKKSRALLISCAVILICLATILGVTYALFSDTETLNHHLRAGKMDITLTRTNLVTTALDNTTGFLVKTESPDDVDFSNTTKNVFDVTDSSLVVPGSQYTAEMKISNNSDTAFAYWIEIRFDDKDDLALADQIEVKVTPNGKTVEPQLLSEGFTVGSESAPVGTLAKTASELFTVDVKFLDNNGMNNAAKGQNVEFDLIVHAIQVKNAPTN